MREKAHIVLIADEAEMRRGMRIAGCGDSPTGASARWRPGFRRRHTTAASWLSQGGGEVPTQRSERRRWPLQPWKPSRWPSERPRSGGTDAILFGPLNKTSLHMAGMDHSDRLHWFTKRLGFGGPFCGSSTSSTTSGPRG
ncbi:hypothetical protein ACPA9J_18130 [Pseudomonas aeruginosa]